MGKLVTQTRICSRCGSDKTYFNKHRNSYRWLYDKEGNGLICDRCYDKEYRLRQLLLNPDYDTVRHLIRRERERNEKGLYYLTHNNDWKIRAQIRDLMRLAT